MASRYTGIRPSCWGFGTAFPKNRPLFLALAGLSFGIAALVRTEFLVFQGIIFVLLLLCVDGVKDKFSLPSKKRLVTLAFFVIPLLACILLAKRNWKLGRVDRKGAFRLGTARFLLLHPGLLAEGLHQFGARSDHVFDLQATSVKHLFELLIERHPALAKHLEEGVAVAIDGQIYQDTLLEPIGPDSEVFVIPQIAGG